MRAWIWDILIPGGLAQRRKRQIFLEQVVDETLNASQLEPRPLGKVLISEQRFREVATYAQTRLGEKESMFSPTDIVQEIRGRGYEPKPPERKKEQLKIPTTLVLGVIAVLLLLRGKERQT